MRLSEELRGRTKRYASAIIRCYVKLPKEREEVSKLQEADESQLWLELLRDDCGIQGETLGQLLRETDELLAIFTTMVAKLRQSGI
jgi:hypothetical protein